MTTTIPRPPGGSRPRRAPDPAARPARRSPPIDPRIRQRRAEVTRLQGQRRLRVLIAAVALLAVSLLATFALRSSWLSVSRIRVVGESGPRVHQIDQVAAGALHHPMISADLGSVTSKVEALAWVDRATVERAWPSTLVVTVTDRRAVAQVGVGKSWAQVDATGRILSVGSVRRSGEPALDGSAGPAQPGATVGPAVRGELAVAIALPAALETSVVSIGSDSGGGVTLTLSGGALVELGQPDQLGAKVAALRTVLSEVDMTGVHSLDLRVPGQPALTRS